MSPLITVLIPTYNHADYLPAALESLLAQTYKNWEAVIINDGSTDDTHKILKRYVLHGGRFRIVTKPNGGVASALNEGLLNARGEWLCWLSSDDLFEPDKLKIHIDGINRTPDGQFFHSGYSLLDNASGEKSTQPLHNSNDKDLQVLNFFRSCWVHGNSWAAHRSVFEKVGGFTQGVYHNAQDFDMWLRISTKYQLHYIPECTCISRMHPAQPTTLFFEAGKLDCVHACYDFLNSHAFADLFPFLDLSKPDSARKAVFETIQLYLDPSAYFHAAGYNPALLERMYEWLVNNSPEHLRTELIFYSDELLRQVMKLNISKEARDFFRIFSNRSKENLRYSPHDFFKHVLEISNGDDDSKHLMKRYIAEHLLFEAAKDKLRICDTDTARVLLEHAYRILPSSIIVKDKLMETISSP